MDQSARDSDTQAFGARLADLRQRAGLTQEAIGKRLGVTRAAVSQWEKGLTVPSFWRMKALADMFNVDHGWFLTGRNPGERRPGGRDVAAGEASESEGIALPAAEPRSGSDMIPVLAVARGGDDQEMFQEDPVDFISRPPLLRGVRDAYAVEVTGTSMRPKYWPGNILHVNPFARPKPGKGVIIWKRNRAILIKEFVRQTSDGILVREYSPREREFALGNDEIVEIHTVVGLDDA